jgi:hypothetical protein
MLKSFLCADPLSQEADPNGPMSGLTLTKLGAAGLRLSPDRRESRSDKLDEEANARGRRTKNPIRDFSKSASKMLTFKKGKSYIKL